MKYVVTKPIQYGAPTGGRTRRGGRERKLVRHDVGAIVELDDTVADKFYQRLEPYFDPKPSRARKPKDERTDTEREADEQATQARAELGLTRPGGASEGSS